MQSGDTKTTLKLLKKGTDAISEPSMAEVAAVVKNI